MSWQIKKKKQNKKEKEKSGKPTATKKTVQTKTRNKCQKKSSVFCLFFF
jgi:hypothetical protein